MMLECHEHSADRDTAARTASPRDREVPAHQPADGRPDDRRRASHRRQGRPRRDRDRGEHPAAAPGIAVSEDQPDALGLTRAAYRQRAAESRARQGLPPTITDPATLDWIASLFRDVPAETEP